MSQGQPPPPRIPDNVAYAQHQHRQQRDARIRAQVEASFERMIDNAQIAAARNPAISQDAFRAVVAAYQNNRAAYIEAMLKPHQDNLAPADLHTALVQTHQRLYEQIKQEALAAHPEAHKAWEAVGVQSAPESALTPLVRMFYNSDKNGLQFGALAGGLIAGFLGFSFTSGSGMLLNILGTVAIGLLGAWAVGKAFDPPDKPLEVPNFRAPRQQQQVGQGQTQGTGAPGQGQQTSFVPPEQPVAVTQNITPAPLTDMQNGFTPTPIPVTAVQPPSREPNARIG